MRKAERGDPEASVWRAVSTLELKGFTRSEIADALYDVAEQAARNSYK